jgi:hypothetical protein
MEYFKVGQKVLYNPSPRSVHHIGTIVKIDKDFIYVVYPIGATHKLPLTGYDKLFGRQLVVVRDDYEV